LTRLANSPRLVLHEVLIRVIADLSVPDSEKYEDLGINFRQMTATIMGKYIAPELAAITSLFEQLKRDAADFSDRAQGATVSDIERYVSARQVLSRPVTKIGCCARPHRGPSV
jgi:hypothetical protein